MSYTSAAPGAAEVAISRLDLAGLGMSKEAGKKKSLHYVLYDVPAPGWTKEILVRSDLTVKSVGLTSTRYIAPEGGKILRSKVDVSTYASQNKHVSSSIIEELDFRSAFCVCHNPEDSSEYLECACGLGGCNHWFHARCVGLASTDVSEFRNAPLICPLCALFLEATGNATFMLNKWVLRHAPANPASYTEHVFKLPTADGTVLQRKDAQIYVNGLVFKPSLAKQAAVPVVNKILRGRKRKIDSVRQVAAGPAAVACGSSSATKARSSGQSPYDEPPHSALNEDEFLQLEAFLSPCSDHVRESIRDVSKGGNNEEDDATPPTDDFSSSKEGGSAKVTSDSSFNEEDGDDYDDDL